MGELLRQVNDLKLCTGFKDESCSAERASACLTHLDAQSRKLTTRCAGTQGNGSSNGKKRPGKRLWRKNGLPRKGEKQDRKQREGSEVK